MVLADFEAYAEIQKEVEKVYKKPEVWFKKAIHNTARMGKFSSDRTISEYADEIWKAGRVKYIELPVDEMELQD